VRHFLEVLLDDVGLKAISRAVKKPLKNLKVACYYGCLLVRPPKILKFDDPENPTSRPPGHSDGRPKPGLAVQGGMFAAAGCRFHERMWWSSSRIDSRHGLPAGADCIAVQLPDVPGQPGFAPGQDINKQTGKDYHLPILTSPNWLGFVWGLRARGSWLEKADGFRLPRFLEKTSAKLI